MPLSTASISCAAFSLSMEKSGSPFFTVSPSCFNQPIKLASSMDQPSRGIMISIGMSFQAQIIRGPDHGLLAQSLPHPELLRFQATDCRA